jgi:hypothetical protein
MLQHSLLSNITRTDWTKSFKRKENVLYVSLISTTDISIRIPSTWSCIEVLHFGFYCKLDATEKKVYEPSFFLGFCSSVTKISLLLWYKVATLDYRFPTFRDNLTVSSSNVEISKKNWMLGTSIFDEIITSFRNVCSRLIKHMGSYLRRTKAIIIKSAQ